MPKGGMPGTPIPIMVTKLEGSMGGGGGGGAYIMPVVPGGGGGGGGGAPGGNGGWTPGGGGTIDGVPIGGGGWAPDTAGCWGCCHGGRVPVPGLEVVVVSKGVVHYGKVSLTSHTNKSLGYNVAPCMSADS